MCSKFYNIHLVLGLFFLTYHGLSYAQSSSVNVVPDPALRACINRELQHDESADITREDMAKLQQLSCEDKNIESAEGIQFASGLKQSLSLTDSKITSIQLPAANHLRYLYLNDNQLKEVKGLDRLPNLIGLYLDNNQLAEAPDFSGLSHLQQLYLYNNQLQKIPDISHMKELIYLNVRKNKLSELPELSSLSKLKYLLLEGNELTSLPASVSDLSKLESLYVAHNKLTSIPNLDKLSALVNLGLADNRLEQIPDLSALSRLKDLRLDKNKLTKIPGLDQLVSLEVLYVQHNQLTEINGIVKLNNLKQLYVTDNRIEKMPDISKQKLERIECGTNAMVNLPDYIYKDFNSIKKNAISGLNFRDQVERKKFPAPYLLGTDIPIKDLLTHDIHDLNGAILNPECNRYCKIDPDKQTIKLFDPKAEITYTGHINVVFPYFSAKITFEEPIILSYDCGKNASDCPSSQTLDPSISPERPSNPKKDNALLIGWCQGGAPCNEHYGFDQAFGKSLTLYADWLEKGAGQHFVQFICEGVEDNSCPSTQVVTDGGPLPTVSTPKKGKHVFRGWCQQALTGGECDNYFDFGQGISADLTLYAVLKEKKSDVNFKLSVTAGKGKAQCSIEHTQIAVHTDEQSGEKTMTVQEGDNIVCEATAKPGYRFVKWLTIITKQSSRSKNKMIAKDGHTETSTEPTISIPVEKDTTSIVRQARFERSLASVTSPIPFPAPAWLLLVLLTFLSAFITKRKQKLG